MKLHVSEFWPKKNKEISNPAGCETFDKQQKKYPAHFHGRGTNLKPNHLQTTVDGITKLMKFVRIGGKSQKLPEQFLAFFMPITEVSAQKNGDKKRAPSSHLNWVLLTNLKPNH